MERLRVRFYRGEEVKYISHLDLMRLWERALRRAGMPLAYTEGFNPHPRLSLAAPLPLGVTSDAELMDVFLTRRLASPSFLKAMEHRLPEGIGIFEVYWVTPGFPSLQSQVRGAEYRVEVEEKASCQQVQERLENLLQTDHLPWQHMRDTGARSYDLRALVYDLWLEKAQEPSYTLMMRLRNDSSGSGRPEQVVSALGFSQHPRSIKRTRLLLDPQGASPGRQS